MTPAKRTAEATQRLRASLVEHAKELVAREGADALTMRALAAEAGCAVGLPYKVFANREELVAELLHEEFRRLCAAFDMWVARAGKGTVGDNLWRYAQLLLDSPSVALVREIDHDARLSSTVDALAAETGVVSALEGAVARYLEAEKRLGRIETHVDVRAFGFLIAGAIHNLLVSGELYPRPRMTELRRLLAAVATRLARQEGKDTDAKDE